MKITVKLFLLTGVLFLMAYSEPDKEDKSNLTVDYSKLFGPAYQHAEEYVQKNLKSTMRFMQLGIDPDFAWSIVFPELIRYNYLRDKAEVATLKTLYVNFGNTYADFSIGSFQMKPSFAERIENDYLLNNDLPGLSAGFQFDTTNTIRARSERVIRLEDKYWQNFYLVLFIKLLEQKYAQTTWASSSDKLLFYATAYNRGYWKTFDEINASRYLKYFHTGLTSTSSNVYSYSRIAEYYYTRH